MPSHKTKEHLMTMFYRPREYSFMPKGDEEKAIVFELPPDYVLPEFSYITFDLASRFGGDSNETVPVTNVKIPPLDKIMELSRDENFSLFIPKHREIAGELIKIFMDIPNLDDLLSVSVYVRDRVNPYLFNYCFSVALLHRKDTQDLNLPSFIHSFPDKYVDGKVFSKARETATVVPEGSRIPIEIPKDFTATDLEEEHRLFYFREDLGINTHHWHWHLVYPFGADVNIANKDRRGELFYYMHHQVLARYNFERLCNKLKRVVRLSNFDEPIEEGYFPKLDNMVAGRTWPPRLAGLKLSNLRRASDGLVMNLEQLKIWRDRIYEAISSGIVKKANGEEIPLTEFEGIDILGNMVESSILSPNSEYYGDLHNTGHDFISFCHDPENKNLESFSVMGDSATAMRDPVFYRWHAFIDNIFEDFKATLPRYTVKQLNYPGIKIEKVSVENGRHPNNFYTYWQQSDLDLSTGMDFQPRGPVYIRFTHLNHREYHYKIEVNNDSGKNRQGTVRIFMAPKYDETGKPWLFRDQKNMFIELDKFRVTLRQGKSTINRASVDSSVTIPFDRSFRDLQTNSSKNEDTDTKNFCSCGWPHHMLIPKGTFHGFEAQLFVMISDYDDDKVVQDSFGVCNDAESYCGLKDRKYPDKRSMGYPFDRQPRDGVQTLKQFLTPNMKVIDCKIVFSDKTLKPLKGQ